MKFSEYLKELNLIAQNINTHDFDVVYSRDDEGNGFQRVHWKPTPGYYDEDSGEFLGDADTNKTLNSICVN